MIVVAHNIRSMHNVGSIFRNAAAFNVEKLYLTGITAQPPRKEITKVALGAVDLVEWSGGEIGEVITQLQLEGYKVYGLEQGPNSQTIEEFRNQISKSKIKVAIILGNEVEGIDSGTVELLDGLIEIPMGKKRSLNVSVASGIAMYEITKLMD